MTFATEEPRQAASDLAHSGLTRPPETCLSASFPFGLRRGSQAARRAIAVSLLARRNLSTSVEPSLKEMAPILPRSSHPMRGGLFTNLVVPDLSEQVRGTPGRTAEEREPLAVLA
jgi:hypothetical protein